MQKILIQNTDAPRVQPSGITLALLNDRVELKCIVKSKPPPKVIFWRDHEGHEPVPLGSNYEMTTDASSDVSFFFSPCGNTIKAVKIPLKWITFIKLSHYHINSTGSQPNNHDSNHSSSHK